MSRLRWHSRHRRPRFEFGSEYTRTATISPIATTTDIFTGIPAGHRMVWLSIRKTVALSGGGHTAFNLNLTDTGGSSLKSFGTGLSLATGLLGPYSASEVPILAAAARLRMVFTGGGGAPNAGTLIARAGFVVDTIIDP